MFYRGDAAVTMEHETGSKIVQTRAIRISGEVPFYQGIMLDFPMPSKIRLSALIGSFTAVTGVRIPLGTPYSVSTTRRRRYGVACGSTSRLCSTTGWGKPSASTNCPDAGTATPADDGRRVGDLVVSSGGAPNDINSTHLAADGH